MKKFSVKKFTAFFTVFLFLFFLIIISKPKTFKAVKSTKTIDYQNVPEMKEILSQDQETRLKAGRKLVERVDVEDALEILEHSTLPHTGEGHLVVHQIGFYAYQKYGVDSILKCKDYFLYACYHGAIIEAATDQGFNAISKMTDKCKATSSRYFQCTHAAGHSILAIHNYDLPEALKTCDSIYEKETDFPDAFTSCHNGAFMENLFGVHDWDKNVQVKREWLNDDPLFPCSAFGEKYQKGCWLNQAARIYQMHEGNLQKTAQTCQAVEVEKHKEWCFDNLSRQIHPLTENSIEKVLSLCKILGRDWEQKCITVNAGSYGSVGDPQKGIEICNIFADPLQGECLVPIVDFMIADTLDPSQKDALCRQIKGTYAQVCLKKLWG